MCMKVIFYIVALSPSLIQCDRIFNGFEMLNSINSHVEDLRSEQKLGLMQISEQINEALSNIRDDIRQIKVEQELMKNILSDQSKIKSDDSHMNIAKVQDDIKLIKDALTEITHNEKQYDDKISNITSIQDKIDSDMCNCQRNLNETQISKVKMTYEQNCDHIESEDGNGIYEILIPSFSPEPFKGVCDGGSHGGGWTVILRRIEGSVNFNRDWSNYKSGFGDLNGDFFLGLDRIHALSSSRKMELLFILENSEGNITYANYDEFLIGDEGESYYLKTLGNYSGSAGDAFTYSANGKFSTHDRDNDLWKNGNCAKDRNGGWWYHYCSNCNLAGKYGDNTLNKGITWTPFLGGTQSLKKATMMLRPRK